MKSPLWFFIIFLFVLQSCNSNKISRGKKDSKKWVSLFNGKDLDNWIPKIAGYKTGINYGNTFRVAHGKLSIRYNEYDSGFKKKFGALYYNKKFINFRLRVQYRFVGETVEGGPPWGYKDGGIQYYCQPPETVGLDQPFLVCLEYHLLGGNNKLQRPTGGVCASGMYIQINRKRNTSYCTEPVVEKNFKRSQWIVAEIDVNNGKITHFVNGKEVIQFENPRFISTNALARKLIINGDDVVRDGYISLQSNSHPIDFKKIEIMEY